MNKNAIAPVVVLSATLLGAHAPAQAQDEGFSKRWYIAGGVGQSELTPDTSEVPGLSVSDDSDVALLGAVGFDFARRWSAELQYADLGTAGLSDGDGIEYSEGSLSALYYLWNGFGASEFLDSDGLDRRAGLSLYGRAGVGFMRNDSVGTVQFERENDAQLLLGLGVEYGLESGFGVRAEFINFDTDAEYRGVTLLYRFGGNSRRDLSVPVPSSIPALPPAPKASDLPALPDVNTLPPPPPPPPEFQSADAAPTLATNPDSNDADADGVVDSFDDCADTQPGTPVNSQGCAMFAGMLDEVNFLVGSDTLTETARAMLDKVAATMISFPDVRVSVEAHTDNQGDADQNRILSRQRALAVVRYLIAQGISLDRFEARAFGESQPIADNSTREGRLMNRRVEFRNLK